MKRPPGVPVNKNMILESAFDSMNNPIDYLLQEFANILWHGKIKR